ncbi:MAG: tetratricopeptide repeat protein [Chloroflexi bacterium]|nr:tetratricopeptide repeat protein [Chloroflexota bacterium]
MSSESPVYVMIEKVFNSVIERFYGGEIDRDEARSIVEKYIPRATGVDMRLVGKGYNILAMLTYTRGDMKSALENFGQAKTSFESAEDPAGIASALNNMGDVHRKLGDLDAAINHYEQVQAVAQSANLDRTYAFALCNTGMAYLEKGDYKQAIELMEKGVGLTDARVDWHDDNVKRLLTEALSRLGIAYAHTGDFEKSKEYANRARFHVKQQTDAQGLADVYSALIEITMMENPKDEKLIEYFDECMKAWQKLGSEVEIAKLYVRQGDYYTANNEKANASIAYFEAIKRFEAAEREDDVKTVQEKLPAT